MNPLSKGGVYFGDCKMDIFNMYNCTDKFIIQVGNENSIQNDVPTQTNKNKKCSD